MFNSYEDFQIAYLSHGVYTPFYPILESLIEIPHPTNWISQRSSVIICCYGCCVATMTDTYYIVYPAIDEFISQVNKVETVE